MNLRRRLVVTTVAVLLAAAACTDGLTDPSPTPTAATEPPSSSPSPTAESDRAAANAEALVLEYYEVLDSIRRDPAKDFTPLSSVSAGADLDTWRTTFDQWKRDGWTMTGTTVPAEVVIQTVNMDQTATDGAIAPTVQLDVCVDVSLVDVVDPEGTSVVLPERRDRSWERLWISNADYANDPETAWRISDRKSLEQEPCAGQ